MSDKKNIIVFTDGACSGNPGPGGWGALLQWNDTEREMSGSARNTTNNRMEMRAVIEALNALTEPCCVKVHSDSALVVNAFKQGWIKSWKKKGWKTSKNKPVQNRDLWEEMLSAMQHHKVEWIKVKGHSDNVRNNRVDRLAVEASRKFQ